MNTDIHIELLQRIASSLEELVTWTRISNFPIVKQILETALDTEQKRLVYHLLDGTKTIAEIQKLSGVNGRFISEWGREWERLGIVQDSEISGRKGRRQRLFDISMCGMDIPEALLLEPTDKA